MKQTEIWEKFNQHLVNEGLTEKRRNKLRSMFAMTEKHLAAPYDKATRDDIEQFVSRLSSGKIKTEDGKAYSGSTKADLKKFLRQFYKWLKGNNEFYPPEVSWIKARIGKDERPEEKTVVTPEQILQIASHFDRADFRLCTLILFDSGFRIQEMLSVTKKKLTWEPFDEEGNCCWWIECGESKTYTRKVNLALFPEEITQYAGTAKFKALSPDDKLFGFSYENYLAALKQAAKKVLGSKKLTPHALRHSSATHYAQLYRGDRIKLAERYGWSYAAQELDTYVRRNSTHLKEAAKISYRNEVDQLREENKRLNRQLNEIKTQIDDLPRALAVLLKVKPEVLQKALKMHKD